MVGGGWVYPVTMAWNSAMLMVVVEVEVRGRVPVCPMVVQVTVQADVVVMV